MRTLNLSGALLALTLIVAANGPAWAQDAPGQDAPAKSATPLACDALAELLLGARDKKVLQHRLFTKRYYRAEERGGKVVLVTGQGQASESGFQFKLAFEALSGDEKGRLIYDFNAEGRLVSVGIFEERRGRERGVLTTIAKGVATQTALKDGQPTGRELQQAPWTGDMISLFSALVLVPSLGDLGLETSATFRVVNEDDKIGRKNPRPKDIRIRREEPSKSEEGASVQVVWVEDAQRSRPLAIVTLRTGADQGVIQELAIDPKPDGRADLRLTLISDKEAKELETLAPLLSNEHQAQRALRQVWSAQSSYNRMAKGAGKYASSLEDLAKTKLLREKGLAEGTSPGYLILIRASADEQSWMAVAVPDEPGKTGRYYLVTNSKGVVYRSQKPIELEDSCQIPAGLERIR